VPWPQEHYGEFYDGDSYIVLNTHGNPPHLQHDIHFWLGENTSQDEAGTAAYKTVELDDFLHGEPVEHREVQGSESEQFVSYFPKGIHVMKGGIESGFHHVGPEQYKPRLFQVKGGFKDCRVFQVNLARDSLNSGDAFVLDGGLKIYHWNGAAAPALEKMKAGQFAQHLYGQRNGKAEVVSFDEPQASHHFWELLGGEGPIHTAEEGNKSSSTGVTGEKKLFRLSDRDRGLKFTEVASGTVSRSALDPKDVFLFDVGDAVFVWIGKGADSVEKRQALGYAHRYVIENNRPIHFPITKIPDGATNAKFDAAFSH